MEILYPKKKRCPNVLALIERVNRMSYWIPAVILFEKTVKKRIEWFEKFVEVAVELKKLNNYSAVMAIMAGLGQSAVSRLKLTKNATSEKCR